MIYPTFSPRRIFAVLVLVAITAWYLGSLNVVPRGTDRVRQEQPFTTRVKR